MNRIGPAGHAAYQPRDRSREAGSVSLTIVVPTLNERANIRPIVDRVADALPDLDWEIVFVDDASSDGTAEEVRRLARRDRRVRLLLRHDRRGLSSAVIEGALAASADIVAVMDGDLQHDEAVLPRLHAIVARGEADIAAASRFLGKDAPEGLEGRGRARISDVGVALANRVFGLRLTDPLTGFFTMRREVLTRALPKLSGSGFKILLDLLTAAHPRPSVAEIPFRFRRREHGVSKLDRRALWDFLIFFLERKVAAGAPISGRFISFALINTAGIVIHLGVFNLIGLIAAVSFATAQVLATFAAMIWNFQVNNLLTYRDMQLRGRNLVIGFIVFTLICSVGIAANVGAAVAIHERFSDLAESLPALAGAIVTAVWNYLATRTFVWDRAARRGAGAGRVTRRVSASAPAPAMKEGRAR